MMKSTAAVQTECDCTAPEKYIVPISCGFKESAKSPKSPERPQQVEIQNWIFKKLGSNPLIANPQLIGVASLSGAPRQRPGPAPGRCSLMARMTSALSSAISSLIAIDHPSVQRCSLLIDREASASSREAGTRWRLHLPLSQNLFGLLQLRT
jgi:hypothetical protein